MARPSVSRASASSCASSRGPARRDPRGRSASSAPPRSVESSRAGDEGRAAGCSRSTGAERDPAGASSHVFSGNGATGSPSSVGEDAESGAAPRRRAAARRPEGARAAPRRVPAARPARRGRRTAAGPTRRASAGASARGPAPRRARCAPSTAGAAPGSRGSARRGPCRAPAASRGAGRWRARPRRAERGRRRTPGSGRRPPRAPHRRTDRSSVGPSRLCPRRAGAGEARHQRIPAQSELDPGDDEDDHPEADEGAPRPAAPRGSQAIGLAGVVHCRCRSRSSGIMEETSAVIQASSRLGNRPYAFILRYRFDRSTPSASAVRLMLPPDSR